jgi:DNA repair exonuclease SbcCD ATPase subunit
MDFNYNKEFQYVNNAVIEFPQRNIEVMFLILRNPTNIQVLEGFVRIVLIVLGFVWILRYACMCCNTQHLREQLEDAENEITEQGHEIEELRKELNVLKQELENYKELVDGVEERYLNCREAAKRFIETHPECDTVG